MGGDGPSAAIQPSPRPPQQLEVEMPGLPVPRGKVAVVPEASFHLCEPGGRCGPGVPAGALHGLQPSGAAPLGTHSPLPGSKLPHQSWCLLGITKPLVWTGPCHVLQGAGAGEGVSTALLIRQHTPSKCLAVTCGRWRRPTAARPGTGLLCAAGGVGKVTAEGRAGRRRLPEALDRKPQPG